MIINKNENGHHVELVLDLIKDYGRYGLYQVSRVVNGVKRPLYQECFSEFDISKIIKNEYKWESCCEDDLEEEPEDMYEGFA